MQDLPDFSSYGEVVRETPAITADPDNPEVFGGLPKQGDTGDAVLEVQQALADRNISSVGEVDGAFGNNTSLGIQEFQEKAGLPRTGVLDQPTYTQLVGTPVRFNEEGRAEVTPVERPDFSSFGEVVSTPEQARTPDQSFERVEPNTITPRLFDDLKNDFGLTDIQAAAIVGNLVVETGNFSSLQEINPTVQGSRGGYGIAQWTGPRRVAFENWAEQNNLPVESYEANYGFLKEELTNKQEGTIEAIGINTISRIKEIQSLEDASFLVQDYFLRPGIPHQNKREAATKDVYEQMTNR